MNTYNAFQKLGGTDLSSFGPAPQDYQQVGTRQYRSWHKDNKGNWQQGEVDVEGKLDGRGIIIYKDGSGVLIGHWKADNGHGEMTGFRQDGAKWVGEWKDGKRHGERIVTFVNGD